MSIVLNQSTLLSIYSLLGVAIGFHFLKNQADGRVLPTPPWTIWQLCGFLVVLDIVGALVTGFVRPYASILRETFGFGTVLLASYQLIAVLVFLRTFHSGLPTVGLSLGHLSLEKVLIGVKWGFGALCVVMFFGMLSPQTMLKSFSLYAYALGKQAQLAQISINELLPELLKVIYGMGLVSVTEEIAYRGLLYTTLRVRMGLPLATITSSLCFLAPHGVLNVPIFLMGCGNAFLLEKYGSLVPGIMIHAIWNIGMRVAGWCLIALQINAKLFFEMGFLVTFLGGISAWAALRLRHNQVVVRAL